MRRDGARLAAGEAGGGRGWWRARLAAGEEVRVRGPRTIAALCCGAAASLVRRLDPLLEGGHEAVPRLQRLLDLGVVDLVGREGQIILINTH